MYLVTEKLWFPPVTTAEPDGLLAIGGDLSPERLLLAYHSGIFPWMAEPIPMWFSPDPRCILFPDKVKISKSMKQVINSGKFQFRYNTSFEKVIQACSMVPRGEDNSTWICDKMINAYTRLHELGHAISAETWLDGKLVGGIYGIRVGKVFCGESMFHIYPNASKFAFIKYCQQLVTERVEMVDCQVPNPHLLSLGAINIPRDEYITLLKKLA